MPEHTLTRFRLRALLLAAGMLLPMIAEAQAPPAALPVDTTFSTISNWTLMATQFLNIMTWFVFTFLTFFLDTRVIFDLDAAGGEGGLMTTLNVIWQLSRNLMNVAFAVALVGAAIYTIVTANKEFVNAHLKNFILAVILVNFSWFIPRVVLDIANVAAATVFSIPSALVSDVECRYVSTKADASCLDSAPLPGGTNFSCACKALADFRPFPGSDLARDLKASDPAWQCSLPSYCIRFVRLDAATSTHHGAILNGLIVNHARLPQLALITRTKLDGDIGDLLLFILRELVVLAIHLALFFPLLALLVALAVRIPVLWITMAFMPFYFLSLVIPDELGLGTVKEYAKKIMDWFLKAAFLPAAVAVPLSIGFIMANAGSRLPVPGLDGITFTLIDGMGSFAQLLWVIMVLAILWTGTFTVLEAVMGDMPGKGLVSKIRSTGTEMGKFAAELPLSFAPIPGVGNLLNLKDALNPRSLRGALRHPEGAMAGFSELGTKRGIEKGEARKTADTLVKETGKKDKLVDAIKKFDSTVPRTFQDLKTALKDAGVTKDVTKENVSSIVEDIHNAMKDNHRTNLYEDGASGRMRTKFLDEVKKVAPPPAAPAPAAPAAPAPGAPPAATP